MSASKTGYVLSFGISQPAVILVDDDASKRCFTVNFKKGPGVVPDDVQLSFVRQACEGGRAAVFVYFACGEGEDDLCPAYDLKNICFTQVAGDVKWVAAAGVSAKGTAYFCFVPPADFDFSRKDYGVSFRVYGFTPPAAAGSVMFYSVPVNFTDVDPVACNAGLDKRFKVKIKSFRLGKQEWVPGQELLPVDFGVGEELSWDVLNADECFLREDLVEKLVALKDSRRVVIDSPKVFVLSAKSIGSSDIAPMQVMLNKPEIKAFSASKECVEPGEKVTLSWDVKSTENITISHVPGKMSDKKSTCDVYPLKDTRYILTAFGYDKIKKADDVTASVEIIVAKPEIIDFSADRLYVKPEDEVVLHWEVKSAAKVTITPTVGEVHGNVGSYVVRPSTSTDYVISAFGHDGSPQPAVTKSIYVTVALSKWEKIGNTNLPTEKDSHLNKDRRIQHANDRIFLYMPNMLNQVYSTADKNRLSNWTLNKNLGDWQNSYVLSTNSDICVVILDGNKLYCISAVSIFSVDVKDTRVIHYHIRDIDVHTSEPKYDASPLSPHFTNYPGASVRIKPITFHIPDTMEEYKYTILHFVSLGYEVVVYGLLFRFPAIFVEEFKLFPLRRFSFGFSLDGVDAVCFRGGLLLAVRDRDSRKITFYSTIGEAVVTDELTKLDTYSKVVDGWFRLFVVNGEAYLLCKDAVVSVNMLQRVSPVPLQMEELPYTGVVDGAFFAITVDNVVWKFKP